MHYKAFSLLTVAPASFAWLANYLWLSSSFRFVLGLYNLRRFCLPWPGVQPPGPHVPPHVLPTYRLFDHLKGVVRRATGKDDPGVVPNLVCGVASAFTGQLVSYPLEAVSRRMMAVGRGPGGPDAVATAVSIIKEGGVISLYRLGGGGTAPGAKVNIMRVSCGRVLP